MKRQIILLLLLTILTHIFSCKSSKHVSRGQSFDKVTCNKYIPILKELSSKINATLLMKIKTHTDFESKEFKTIRAELNTVAMKHGLTQNELYILRPSNQKGLYYFAVMLHQKPFIGNTLNPALPLRKYYEQALSGKGSCTPVYKDSEGQWMSILSPILDKITLYHKYVFLF